MSSIHSSVSCTAGKDNNVNRATFSEYIGYKAQRHYMHNCGIIKLSKALSNKPHNMPAYKLNIIFIAHTFPNTPKK